MLRHTARIEIYMKSGAAGVCTSGAVVRADDFRVAQAGVATRLTGGSVLDLEPDNFYVYQFNIAGDGRFTLAARMDGGEVDLETTAFDSGEAKLGGHGSRSFPFKVPRLLV